MNFSAKDFLKKQLDNPLRQLLDNQLERIKGMPEMLHGTLLMSAADNFKSTMLEKYDKISIMLALSGCYANESEYKDIIEDITESILSEYVKLPPKTSKKDIDESHYTFPKEWFDED